MTDAVNWIRVGALADSFAPDANVSSRNAGLVGKTRTSTLESGEYVVYAFASDSELRWRSDTNAGRPAALGRRRGGLI